MTSQTQTQNSNPDATVQELPIGEYAALIGIDWGDAQHVITLWAPNQPSLQRERIQSQPEAFHHWMESLAQRFAQQPVAIAVEASKGPIVDLLLQYSWVTIYPVHPVTSRRYSKAFTPSGAANDQPDADNLLEILRYHRDRLRALLPQDKSTGRLAALVTLRRSVVDDQTRLGNELTSLLKAFFPQALQLTGAVRHSKLALEFLRRWPDLESLKKAKSQTLRGFYHKHHVRRPELIEKRLALVESARPLSSDPVLIETSILRLRYLLAQMQSLQPQLQAIEAQIESVFASHTDKQLFESLPGAGAALAPRLCVLFGTDRKRWLDASELQKYYGVAPVIEASGKSHWTHWRWNAPLFHRQTLVEWAGVSVRYCSWAGAYYHKQRQRQKSHAAILRSLAFKWLRILFVCWKNNTPYDEQTYLRQLKLKGSYLPDLINA